MPTNSDNSQGDKVAEPTSVFEVPAELIAGTKKAESVVPPTKKDLGKRRYFLFFKTLEGTPSFEVVNKATVGRTAGDITIADPNLSNEHATFSVQDGLMTVTDHGSTNGTFIDGKRIKPGKNMIVDQGDHVLLGPISVEIKLEMPDKYSKLVDNVTLSSEEQVEEKEKKPSFFARLKEKFKSKKKKTDKKFEVKNILPSFTDTVGAATRLWAFLGDVSLTIGLSIIIGENEYFNEMSNELYKLLFNFLDPHLAHFNLANDPSVNTIKTDLKIVFPLILLFYVIKLLSTFLFGVSIAQFLMGLKGGKSVLWNRAGGFLRVLLEIVTAPFLIFDIPALFSRRTVKEILTFTNISAGNRLLRFIGTLIFVPALFVFAFVSPVLRNLDYLEQGVLVEEKVVRKKKKKKDAEVTTEEAKAPPTIYKISSPILNFTGEVSLSENFLFIPDFELSKAEGRKQLMPVLKIYDLEKKVTGEFSVFKLFSMVDLIHVAEEGNPLFPFNFKELSKWYANRNSPTLKKNNTKVKGEFSSGEAAEMETLFIKSLQLHLIDIHEHMLEYGPFVKGFADVREIIKQISENSNLRSVTLQKINKNNFLFMPMAEDEDNSELIIPLSFSNGVIYRATWKGGKAKNIAENFYKEFFSKIVGETYRTPLEFPKSESEGAAVSLNPVHILDLFFSKKLVHEEREILLQYVFNYFYSLAETSFKKEDTELQKLLIRVIGKYIQNLKLIPGLDPAQLEKAEQGLLSIENALKSKDASFFGTGAKE